MVSWPGRYRDRHGSEQITIDNDGRLLTTTIRGVHFAGQDFDCLEPECGSFGVDTSFSLSDGCLCACELEWDIPVPVVAAGVQIDGVLRCALVLGAPRPSPPGGIDTEELTIALHTANAVYGTGRPFGFFEFALDDIHRQLPAETYLKACITCAWSDYSPGGGGLFMGLACFRDVKDGYRAVRGKRDIFALWSSRTGYVQETHLCPEYERRVGDVGYRGQFPSRAR
jgi:Family of unknown function (DUF6304)